MTRASAAGAVAILWFAGMFHVGAQTQSPALTPAEKPLVDAQLADRHLEAITVGALMGDNQPVKDVLRSLSQMTGLITRSDQSVPELDTHITVKWMNLRLDEALRTLLDANKIAFAVTGSKSVFIYSDTPDNRQKFAESVRVFALAKADPGRMIQILMAQPLMTAPDGIRPTLVAGPQSRTISVRATTEKMAQIATYILANDK